MGDQDRVPSDVDVVGYHPRKAGADQVVVVTCKSWQPEFNPRKGLTQLQEESGPRKRATWHQFRELWVPKWSQAFRDKIFELTGVSEFSYRLAVTRLQGQDASQWANAWAEEPRIKENLAGSSFGFLSLGSCKGGNARSFEARRLGQQGLLRKRGGIACAQSPRLSRGRGRHAGLGASYRSRRYLRAGDNELARAANNEALVRMGRLTEAEAELAPFEELAAVRERHSAQAAAGRVRGLLEAAQGRNEQATTAFEEALEHARMVPMPFERALIQLFYGAFLRRSGQRKAAAAQLGAAHEVFDRLGARPYLEVGDRELAGCGQVRARRSAPEANQLTPYETAVARLVAEGLSNREVAGELVISVKTVEYHLSAIYRKLDLRSRGQLAVHMRHELLN